MTTLINSRYKFNAGKNYVDMSAISIANRDKFLAKIRNSDQLVTQKCYVCNVSDFKIISEVDRYGFYYPTGVCKQCGNIQQEKYYNNEALTLFYSTYYRKIYGDSTPKSLFDNQRNEMGVAIFEFTKQFVKPEKVLEVGCGAGGILSRFADFGCDVLGLDFDEDYLEEAKKNNIPVRRGSIEKLKENDKFNLIILSHVLEHIIEPSKFLKSLANHLTENGVLYIEVPSIENVRNGGYKFDLLNYFQNAHTIHFTKLSLKLICKKAKLRPKIITDFIHSCWEKSAEKNSVSEKEKSESLKYTHSLLEDIEARRVSFRVVLLSLKTKLRNLVLNVLSMLGLKLVFKSIYFKLRGKF